MESKKIQRKAILIGNASYCNMPRLDTPVNDVTILGGVLKKYGYDVDIYLDVTKNIMNVIVDRFKAFHSYSGIYILYYSGHGFSDNGKNYITSIDTDVSCLCYESDSIDRFFAGNASAVSVVFIDACRKSKDGIFREYKSRSVLGKTINSNMIDQYVPDNTMVCFSTSFGRSADDRFEDSGMSPYAYFLNENMNHFSSDIYSLLNKTRLDVARGTGNRQVPIELSSLKKSFSIYDDAYIPSHVNFVQNLIYPSPACAACKLFPSYLWGAGSVLVGMPPVSPVQSIRVQLRKRNILDSDDVIESISFNGYNFVVGTRCGRLVFRTPNGFESRSIIQDAIFDVKMSSDGNFYVVSSNEGVFLYDRDGDSITRISEKYSYALELSDDSRVVYFYADHSLFSYNLPGKCVEEVYRPNGFDRPYFHIYGMRKIGSTFVCATSKGLLLYENSRNVTKLLVFTKDEYPGFTITKNITAEWSGDFEVVDCRCIDVSPCRKYVACGTSDGRIIIWDICHEFLVKSIIASSIRQDVTSIAWGVGNNIIAVINSEMLIEVIPMHGVSYMHHVKGEYVNGVTEDSDFDEFGGLLYSSPLFIK